MQRPCLTKTQEEFVIDSATKLGLSKAEILVFARVILGEANQEIADKLCVAEKTVKFHLTNIFKKLKITEGSKRICLIWFLDLEMLSRCGKTIIPNDQMKKKLREELGSENLNGHLPKGIS